MNETLETLSAIDQGIITADMLRAAGVHSHAIERAIAEQQLVRIRPAAYVAAAVWKAANRRERYRLRVIATVRLSPRPLVISHLSAAAMHGLPTIGEWPGTVHTLEPAARGGASARFLTSHRGGPEAETIVIDGVEATALPRTLVDVAASEQLVRSVTPLDAALHRADASAADPLTKEGLLDELERVHPVRGRRKAESAIDFANGRADSPGESLSRVRMFELGFEVPELQVRFRHANHGRDAIVDFHWRRIRRAGEFDGKLKYTRGRLVQEGEDPGLIVWEEKRREDALRRGAVDSMSRWVWDEVLAAKTFYRLLVEAEVPFARRAA